MQPAMKSTPSTRNIVRSARPEDIADIVGMGEAFFVAAGLPALLGDYSPESVSGLIGRTISNDSLVTFVSISDGKIVGIACGIVHPHFLKPSIIVGQELFWWVDPNFRNGGHGALLMTSLEEWAKTKGAEAFIMVSLESLSPEIVNKSYLAAGYSRLEYSYVKRIT